MNGHDFIQTLTPTTRITQTLWMGGCPVGRAPAEFDTIVCLYPWAPYAVADHQVLVSMRMYDSNELPDEKTLHALADFVNIARRRGQVLVHCQIGINRSGMICALALIHDGMEPKVAIETLRNRRHRDVLSNKTFEEWLLRQGAA